jgi:multidrug efflux pump subunit AcrB
MNPILFALHRPYTIVVGVLAVALLAGVALTRLSIDIFPDLNSPVIYVAQPYGGMSPQQMEGHITNYFEYHFLYINGIERVESRSIQGVALMKLFFHPGTNMAQAMAETVGYITRSRSFMPPNTVPPFVMRFDAGSVPVGYLTFRSETKTIGQIQDEALFRVRPMFASLPGVSAPPPFGGNQRTIILRADPERLRSHGMSPDEIVATLAKGNAITPAGTLAIEGKSPMVPVNSTVEDFRDLEKLPIRPAADGKSSVHVRDVARVIDGQDIATSYGLVNGKPSVYILVTKRADASTLSVVNAVKANLAKMQAVLSDDIKVGFEFDQSPFVTRAMWGVVTEAFLGAILTGLMVLLFLRDWRAVIVVVLNIPLALLGAILALWFTGQTINLMTLGGLALAVGILVDEATVEVENIHTQMPHSTSMVEAVRAGNLQTAVPRLLAMLCILAVFIPSYFMQGTARALFMPLALAVGFAMVSSYLLSSTLVPVLCVWLLRREDHSEPTGFLAKLQENYAAALAWVMSLRTVVLTGYAGLLALVVAWWMIGHPGLGREIFPTVDAGQFQLRIKAPDGTNLEETKTLAQEVLTDIARLAGGPDKIDISVSLVGTASYNYPINSIFLWTSGPQEAVLRVAVKHSAHIRIEDFKNRLRTELPKLTTKSKIDMQKVRFSFEAGDIVSLVMGFGANTPIEVAVNGPSLPDNMVHAEKIRKELEKIPSLRDLAYEQALSYPTLEVIVDREKAGYAGVTASEVGNAVAPMTLSSRFVTPNYWRDPKSGIGYQVQVEVEAPNLTPEQLLHLPIKRSEGRGDSSGPGGRGSSASSESSGDGNSRESREVRLGDVASVKAGSRPGQIDRVNMRRQVSLIANVQGEDLGRVADRVEAAVKAAGAPPRGAQVAIRGQIVPMRQLFSGLGVGLLAAVVVILLLLTAYFQSVRLSLVVISTTPAVLLGVAFALVLSFTTLNIQSFMGTIMAIGVAVANAILLVTFAEQNRRSGLDAAEAASQAARGRLRPILMTSCAMIAGILPMAIGFGEGGEQTAALGRAVVGGLLFATMATLFVLPGVFAQVMHNASVKSASMLEQDGSL